MENENDDIKLFQKKKEKKNYTLKTQGLFPLHIYLKSQSSLIHGNFKFNLFKSQQAFQNEENVTNSFIRQQTQSPPQKCSVPETV